MKKLIITGILLCMTIAVVGCGNTADDLQLGHSEHDMQLWYNANCQAPRTCGICGYTEGELGDHSVKVGTCIHCNEFQNKDLFDEIKTDLTELTNNLKAANDLLQEKANDSASTEIVYAAAIETVAPDFDKEKAKLENILVLCGEYEELADIKRDVETAVTYFPVKPSEMTLQENKTYITNANMCYMYIMEALIKTQFVS